MDFLWRGKRFELLFAVLLTAFTAYALLDTFVIPRRYASADGSGASAYSAESSGDPSGKSTGNLAGESAGSLSGNLTGESSGDPPGESTAEILREEIPLWRSDGETAGETAEGDSRYPADTGHRRQRRGGRSLTETAEESDGGTAPAPWAVTGESGTTGGTASGSGTAGETIKTAPGGEVIRAWSDENISVTVSQYRTDDTDVYVADVVLSSPEYLKTALAGNAYGRNIKEKTSVMAAENAAVLAINGDFYGARNSGYVIRNGVLYRESGQGGQVLAVFGDGSFQIVDDRQVTARELLDAGAVQAFSFGPALLVDGEIAVTQGQEVGKAMASNPRTALGVVNGLHYVFVTADGRTGQSEGLSLYELAAFLRDLGVRTAYNLDGGGSSTMVFQGEILNHPTTSGNSVKERSVSDIVYIGP